MYIKTYLISIIIIISVFSTKGQNIDSCPLVKNTISWPLQIKHNKFPDWLISDALEKDYSIGISDP